jgi:hypothetical protein
MIVLPQSLDADPEVHRIGPLEEGESLQFVTLEGDTIAVEREHSGRTIALNGKELENQGYHGTVNITTHLDGENNTVRIHKEHGALRGDSYDEDTDQHMYFSIMEHDDHPGIRVDTLRTGGDSPQIIIVDRIHVEDVKEEK